MKDSLLSSFDENSITLEVCFRNLIVQNNPKQFLTTSFSMDLIVKDTVLLDDCLLAIREGLIRHLKKEYHFEWKNHSESAPQKDADPPNLWDRCSWSGRMQWIPAEHSEKCDSPEQQIRALDDAVKIFDQCWRNYRSPKKPGTAPLFEERNRCPSITRDSVLVRNQQLDSDARQLGFSALTLNRAEHGRMQLRQLGFVNSSRLIFDAAMNGHPMPLFTKSETPQVIFRNFPDYFEGKRDDRAPDSTPVQIALPAKKPRVLQDYSIWYILATLFIIFFMLLLWSVFPAQKHVWALAAVCVGVLIFAAFSLWLGFRITHYLQEEEERIWKHSYEEYIRNVIGKIVRRQHRDAKFLRHQYKAVLAENEKLGLLVNTEMLSWGIYSRKPCHPDFLCARVGLTNEDSRLVRSVFSVKGDSDFDVFSDTKYYNIRHERGKPFQIQTSSEPMAPMGRDGSSGYVSQLPSDLAEEYAYLKNAPVMLDLYRNRFVGLLLQNPKLQFDSLLQNLIFDLCFHQSPDNLQFVILDEQTDDQEEQQRRIRLYRNLPQFQMLFPDRSVFAFSEGSAKALMDLLYDLLKRRKDQQQENLPHIVLVVLQEFGLRKHPLYSFAEGLDDLDSVGMTMVFCTRYAQNLPNPCTQILRADDDEHWYLIPGAPRDGNAEQLRLTTACANQFRPDLLPTAQVITGNAEYSRLYRKAYHILSALRPSCSRADQIPERIELLRMLENRFSGYSIPQLPGNGNNINRDWIRRFLGETMRFVNSQWKAALAQLDREQKCPLTAPIGARLNGIIDLSLGDPDAGRNILVAGGKGSGKTNFLLSYISTLSALYPPEQLQLLLLDPRNGELASNLDRLPHNLNHFSPAAMLKKNIKIDAVLQQCLTQLSELYLERRQLLNLPGIDSIDQYQYYHRHAARLLAHKNQIDPAKVQIIQECLNGPKMPHILLVIDDLEELMSSAGQEYEYAQWLDELKFLFRNSARAGLHLIAACRQPELLPKEFLDCFDQRLCLRVDSPEASVCMTEADLASSVFFRRPGRAVLFNSISRRFEQLQLADAATDLLPRKVEPFSMTLVPADGEHMPFFSTEDLVQNMMNAPSETSRTTKDAKSTDRTNRTDRTDRNTDRRMRDSTEEMGSSTRNTDTRTSHSASGGVDKRNNPRSPSVEPDYWGRKTGMEQYRFLVSAVRKCFNARR